MSRFLDSVSIIISTFCKHAKEDGDQSKLSRRRMKEFIQKEFADAIANPHDPQTIDKILQFLEWDGDGEIDFNEFLLLVFRVAKACYWYLQKGPCLLQKTKLVTSGKTLQEPEIKNRGSRRQLQEEEPQTRETNRHPPCEPEPQRDTRIQELETLEETESHHQQRTTQSRDDAKRSTRTRELIPQVHEERSQEPCDQHNSQRRRQPPEQDRLEDLQHRKCGSSKARQPGPQADERQNREGPQPEQLADVKSHRHPCEPKPLPDQWSGHQPREPALPAYDQRNHQLQHQQAVANGGRSRWPHEPEEADRGSHKWPRKHELLTDERSRYHLRELEQKALEQSSRQPCESECLDSERPHQSYIQEPLELDKRYFEKCGQKETVYKEEKQQEDENEYRHTQRRSYQVHKCEEQDDAKRKDQPRRHQREEYETERSLPQEYERDGTRNREAVRYERTRETTEVSAEADVKVHRVSRELQPRDEGERRDRSRECEEPEDETRICRARDREEPVVRERRLERQRDLEVEVHERRSRLTREREERGAPREERETHKEEERKSLYQTVDVDSGDLCPPGEISSVTDMRVRYIPADPDIQPEVQVLPGPCEPQTIAYLIHVIQNLNDPNATTYEIVCHQPHNLEQPIYVRKCYVSPQAPAVPCVESSVPKAESCKDDGKTREAEEPQHKDMCRMKLGMDECQKRQLPASSSQENSEELDEPQKAELKDGSAVGVKVASQQASAPESDGVKSDNHQVEPREDGSDNQHPRMPDAEEKKYQCQGDGSKANREKVPQESESSCQVSKDREAKSCLPLSQAPEPQKAHEPGQRAVEEQCPQPPRRDEADCCQEDEELPPPERSCQPREEENIKKSPQQESSDQPQQEEEPRLCTKQSQGSPGPVASQKATSQPARDEAKAS